MQRVIELFDFFRRTAVLGGYQCEEVGLSPCFTSGAFEPHRLQELEQFCHVNSQYHIISGLRGGIDINHVVPDAVLYYIGSGDDDPSLAGVHYVDPVAYFEFDAAVDEFEARMRQKKCQ